MHDVLVGRSFHVRQMARYGARVLRRAVKHTGRDQLLDDLLHGAVQLEHALRREHDGLTKLMRTMPPAMFTSLTPSAKTSFVMGQVSNSFGLGACFAHSPNAGVGYPLRQQRNTRAD